MAFQLPHTRAQAVTEVQDDRIILDYGLERPKKTVFRNDLIAIVSAPKENGFVEGDSLLLSLGRSSDDTKDSTTSSAEKYVLEVDSVPTLPNALLQYQVSREGTPDHLQLPKEDLHIIVSTLSGACEADQYYKGILGPVLSLVGFLPEDYKVHHTTSEQSITDFASHILGPRANQGRLQTVVLLSGDGGIVDTINGVLATPRSDTYVKPVIGLLALGTGNALANSSALNSDSSKGLRSFLFGEPLDIPTFLARFSPGAVHLTNEGRTTNDLPKDEEGAGFLHGAVVASWGLHASLVADSDTTEYRKYGSDRFSMAAQELLAPADGSAPHSYHGEVTVLRAITPEHIAALKWKRDEHMYILATFVSNLEQRLRISPDSRPLDGKLRLLHFGALSGEDVNAIFAKAFDDGKHVTMDNVGYEEIEGIRIVFKETEARWRRVCIDGKIVLVEEGGWFEVHKEQESRLQLVTIDY